jgi:hypothetical protein
MPPSLVQWIQHQLLPMTIMNDNDKYFVMADPISLNNHSNNNNNNPIEEVQFFRCDYWHVIHGHVSPLGLCSRPCCHWTRKIISKSAPIIATTNQRGNDTLPKSINTRSLRHDKMSWPHNLDSQIQVVAAPPTHHLSIVTTTSRRGPMTTTATIQKATSATPLFVVSPRDHSCNGSSHCSQLLPPHSWHSRHDQSTISLLSNVKQSYRTQINKEINDWFLT